MDGVDKSGMVRLICDTTGLPNARIGKIDLRRSFSFFEVPEQYANMVLDKFRDVFVNDRPIKIEITEEGGYPRDKKGKPYEGKGGFGGRGGQGGKYSGQGNKYGQGDGGSRKDRFAGSGRSGGFQFGAGKGKSGEFERPARRRD